MGRDSTRQPIAALIEWYKLLEGYELVQQRQALSFSSANRLWWVRETDCADEVLGPVIRANSDKASHFSRRKDLSKRETLILTISITEE